MMVVILSGSEKSAHGTGSLLCSHGNSYDRRRDRFGQFISHFDRPETGF